MTVETKIFKIPANEYIKPLFIRFVHIHKYLILLILAVIICLSYWDINFIYVALMTVTCIFPFAIGHIYFYHAFSPECIEAIRQGRVEFDEAGINHIYIDTEMVETGDRRYSWDDFVNYEFTEKFVKLRIKETKYGILIIPFDSFLSFEDSKTVQNLIIEKIKLL